MIRVLPPEVAARIAAGEVVDRPASVVKELVENALDAGARRIQVEVQGGGVDLIRVSDDGQGIPADQVELAFQRHATSKITDEADLRALRTLGFRGEALPSIAAVARVELSTRQADEVAGSGLTVEYGRRGAQRVAGRSPGTSVSVQDLFYELPARRKFLKPRGVEASATAQVVSHYALAFPEVAFALRSGGRAVLNTPGDGDRWQVLVAVYGPDASGQMLALQAATGRDRERIFAAVSGFIGRQTLHRASRSGLSIFVNRRPVQHRLLAAMVEQAYQGLLPTGRHPVAVLDITVPPEEADFNVHPAKVEVKLLRDRAIAGLVHRAVQDKLAESAAVPVWAGGPLDEGQAGEALRALRVLGQMGGTYIIAEGSAGLYLVDQHAAHERVLLEELRQGLGRPEAAQYLLEPLLVQAEPRQAELASLHRQELAELGFVVDEFGPRSLLVRAVPSLASGRDPSLLLCNTLDGAEEDDGLADWRERLALSLSCHTAVRAGDPLDPEEMAALVARLGEAELCRTCAHGRPTAILLTHNQLEREFGRR